VSTAQAASTQNKKYMVLPKAYKKQTLNKVYQKIAVLFQWIY